MTSWHEFSAAEDTFAIRVHRLLTAKKHLTMATLRRDGSPRISGTEVEFVDGELRLGIMAGALKAQDLRRDARIAIHSPTIDPPEGDQSMWTGEAKVAGLAVEGPAAPDGSSRFRIDITEVVMTTVGTPADHLLIESWHPGRGYHRLERH